MMNSKACARTKVRAVALTIVALLAMWGLWSAYKIALIRGLPRYDPASDVGFFWSESATHYRYYRMIADPTVAWSDIASTLRLDTRAQYPEGVEVLKRFPFGMELFYGALHRWFAPTVTPHVFLLNAICIFTGLSLVMVFLLTLRLTGSGGWSLCAVALYAGLTPSFSRTVQGAFLYEDFAMPFLLGAVALFLPSRGGCKTRPNALVGLAAGLLAGLAAALWHISQYPLALTFAMMSFRDALDNSGKMGTQYYLSACGRLNSIVSPIFCGLIGFVAAAIALPVLRTNVFLLSLPMAALLHWVLWRTSQRVWQQHATAIRIVGWAASLAAIVVLFQLSNPLRHTYSHVFEYLVSRATHPFGMPADPTEMSFTARTFWEYSFLGASAGDILGGLRFGLLLMPFAFIPLLRRRHWESGVAVMGGAALVLLVLGLTMRRLLVLTTPFVAVASIAGLVAWLRAMKRPNIWAAAAVAIVAANVVTVPHAGPVLDRPPRAVTASLVNWLRANTTPDEAFFAQMAPSAVILLHADRPSLVHPIFEAASVRAKYEELMVPAFGDEEQFWRALRKYDASYFILDTSFALTEGPGSMRYIAGHGGDLDASWVATQCSFSPEDLRFFDLVWQNDLYRVFRVRKDAADRAERRLAILRVEDELYNPFFDVRNFGKGVTDTVGASACHTFSYVGTHEGFARIRMSNRLGNQGVQAFERGDAAAAKALLGEAVRICPNNFNAWFNLSLLALSQGDIALAEECVVQARRIAPLSSAVVEMADRVRRAAEAKSSKP